MSPYLGFVGQNVTISCTGYQSRDSDYIKSTQWHYTCSSCGDEWSLVASFTIFPDKTEFLDAIDGKLMSPSTGALTIVNFQPTDEGLYKCDFMSGGMYVVELKSAGEFFVMLLY